MSLSRVTIDHHRFLRTGVAEAIFSPGKRAAEIAAIGAGLVSSRHEAGDDGEWPVIATRIDEPMAREVEALLVQTDPSITLLYDAEARILEFAPFPARTQLGFAVVVTAGTTDRGPAAEAAFVLAAYGAEVSRIDDVGVAGIHRLLDPASLTLLERAQVIVAVAGMEGALPTVIAGLVKAPVIAVPSPVGYGVAEGGHAALNTMLASCAPGLAVVNIGNGFGAATLAIKILRAR